MFIKQCLVSNGELGNEKIKVIFLDLARQRFEFETICVNFGKKNRENIVDS